MNWMIWLSYVNGMSYAFEGMLVNEFKYPIQCNPAHIVPFSQPGDVTYQSCNLQGATPGSLVVSSQNYLESTFGYKQSHLGRNIGVLIAFSVLYLVPTLFAAEIMNFGGSGGGMTIFARTKNTKATMAAGKQKDARTDDPEAAAAGNNSSHFQVGSDTRRYTTSSDGTAADGGTTTAGNKDHQSHSDRAVFTWRDLNLVIPTGRKLLHNVDGFVRPGQMTALMGASGAGKTTLLTTLSQRMAIGELTGDMLVDGKPLGPGFQKSTGFVLQGDVHLATQTVREAIEFSALLRQPADISREQKIADADRAIRLLELEDLQDALIGVPGAGLGVERRKRVTIAVELAAKPDLLLFLDEPTSGLDSAGATSICRLLRRLAEDEGQAILCTIHQPSALLFESFDNLLLLQPGGRTAYMGQIGDKPGFDSNRVRTYFESHGAQTCPPDANVAEYMLEVVSGDRGNGIDWGDEWAKSEDRKEVRKEIDDMVNERSQRPQRDDPRAMREFSADPMTQVIEVSKRQFRDVWRDSAFAYGILFSNMVVGLVAGGAFAHLGYSPTDYQNRVFVVFLVILNFVGISFHFLPARPARLIRSPQPAVVNAIIAKFFELRVLFEVRESPSKTYAWYALVASFIITTAPIAVVASTIYFLPTFFIPYYSRGTSVAGYFYLMTLLSKC
jgi:ATP-binding cassette subfamily G (WHITE) protein 2 (SNQ2)